MSIKDFILNAAFEKMEEIEDEVLSKKAEKISQDILFLEKKLKRNF